jgi:hypothetical protein
MGSSACLLVLIAVKPSPQPLAAYALFRAAMADIATWILFPSLILTLAAGLLAIAVNRAFKNAGWAWAKLATGVLIFEAGLVNTIGPIQEEAKRSAAAVAGQLDPAMITGSYGAERGTLWFLVVVSTANVILGIWRPKLTRIPD